MPRREHLAALAPALPLPLALPPPSPASSSSSSTRSNTYYRHWLRDHRLRRNLRRLAGSTHHSPHETEEPPPPPRPGRRERPRRTRPNSDSLARARAQGRFRHTMPITIEEEHSTGPGSDTTSASSASSHRRLTPHANYFAPPLYGRPGTPIPPSPSITSLLIPSRPTTPDISDDEVEAEPSSGRGKTTTPPRVPTYEYYGFVLYIFSSLTFAVYLLWSYLPSPFLHALGIYYYPNRWWSLAIPAWLVMLLVWIFVALASYNVGYLTKDMGSVETIVDDAGFVAVLDSKGRMRGTKGKARKGKVDYRRVWSEGTDGVMDVPLGGVCEVLHAEGGVELEDAGEDGEGWVMWILGM